MANHANVDRDVPWAKFGLVVGVLLALAGAMFGIMLALDGAEKGRYDHERRIELQEACIAGNENACRIYEVDYARDGGGL